MFIVIELQTLTSGAVANIVTSFNTQAEAESAYHSILASAAVSDLPKHAAVLLTNEGFSMQHQCYVHNVQQPTE